MKCELRPGGMLVQKRTSDSNQNSNIKIRVKHESAYHEISLSSQATFGELKKMLVGPTGLHPHDQKLMFKEKQMDSRAFLDVCGVKNRSKIVLVEDKLRKKVNMEKPLKEIEAVRFEVDKLAKQVASIEMEISGGKKVEERALLNLIEMLMMQLIKLDGVDADGDVKLLRKMQVKRVQKYIETLDMLKIRNSGQPQQQNKIFTGQTFHEQRKNRGISIRGLIQGQ